VVKDVGILDELDVLAHQFHVEVARVASIHQRVGDFGQRDGAFAKQAAVGFAVRGMATVGQMDNRNLGSNRLDPAQVQLRQPEMVGIEGDLQVR